jgi:hypothetical protein
VAYRLIQTLAGERIDEMVKGDSGLHPAGPDPPPVAAPAVLATFRRKIQPGWPVGRISL